MGQSNAIMQTAQSSVTSTTSGLIETIHRGRMNSMTDSNIQQNSVRRVRARIAGMTCSVENCADPVKSKGMCKLHYQRSWRTGSATVDRPCHHLPPEKKLWLYVDKTAPNGCWVWTGFKDKDGYGKIRVGKTSIGAHRVSYELANGPIPDGLLVLHANECNNPSCVNPAHLRLGDHDENMRDRVEAGHYLTGERHVGSKLTEAQAREIKNATGTLKEVAQRFSISESQAGNIRRGDQWKVLDSADYCKAAEEQMGTPTLFDILEIEAAAALVPELEAATA